MPDGNLPGDQDKAPEDVQSRPDDLFFISPAARWFMGLRMEAPAGAGPAALQNGGSGDQGGNGGGEQSKGSGGGFNWEMFPDVPEEQRPLLEPHLKQVQGHVTQMEQRFAPFKPFVDGQTDPQYLQGLVSFDQAFNQDPVGTFLKLAENLQKEGSLTSDLDLNVLRSIVEGKEVDEGEGGGPQASEGEEVPAYVEEIRRENQELKERLDNKDQQETQTQQQAKLDEAIEGIRGQLKEAGFTAENMPDTETITGLIIAHRGDVDKALASITGLRDGVLAGFANGRKSEPKEGEDGGGGPTMPKGSPKAPRSQGRGVRSEFRDARAGAEQFLSQKLQQEAQE